ncbi:MAG: hypothetical protein ACKVZH_28560 [Blastocatellia bacterium]
MKAVKMLATIVFVLLMAIPALGQSEQTKQAKSAIPKFEGSWVLNREKSSGLTGGLGNAEIRLVVSQDTKQLTAEQKVVIRDREQPSQELIYKLDGSETEAEVSRPMAGTMKLKARWIENGKTLELQSTISGESEGKEVSISTQEQWRLMDAETLKITRNRKSPQGIQTFRLVFQKQ